MIRFPAYMLLAAVPVLGAIAAQAASGGEEEAALSAGDIYAPPAADAPEGRHLFYEKCEMCHGERGMGTGLLARRLETAELLKRDDLDARFVVAAVRAGIGNMPAMPRGEVSDADLEAIAEYLAQQ